MTTARRKKTGLTHVNTRGEVHMVGVGDKDVTRRVAIAAGEIRMHRDTLALVRSGSSRKGDVLGVARVAAIMAAKRTAEIIPLCHPLSLTHVDVELKIRPSRGVVECRVQAETNGRTGVEMEALVAVQAALATVYDMCKAVDRGMVIGNVRLLRKSGGRSGEWVRTAES